MSCGSADWHSLGRAIGAPASRLQSALGDPESRHSIGADQWLVFLAPGRRLRVRCEGRGEQATVCSWSLTLESGLPTLRKATEPFGLWPACAPDAPSDESEERLIRRAIAIDPREASLTLTATVRDGLIRKLDLFDEEPDWL